MDVPSDHESTSNYRLHVWIYSHSNNLDWLCWRCGWECVSEAYFTGLKISNHRLYRVYDSVLWIWLAVTAATRLKFGRAYAGVFMFGIALIGAILLNTISLHKKVGLLFCYWLTSAFFAWSYVSSITDIYVHSRCYFTFHSGLGMACFYHRWPHKEWVYYVHARVFLTIDAWL